MSLHYLIGDATKPILRPALIIHICNDIGAWGSGFVIAISRRYSKPEAQYRTWAEKCNRNLPLGENQVIQIEDDLWVVNMIAQHNIGIANGIPPLRIESLRNCLEKVNKIAIEKNASVHAPRIGAVRSGGRWEDIERVILSTLTMETYIYTLESEKDMWDTVYENDKG